MNKNNKIQQTQIVKFDSRAELFKAVAVDCEFLLNKALARHGEASFIIPGGTTPAPVFIELSQSDLDWKKITIAQSDERWVESNHAQSNQRLTEQTLRINNASSARYIPMKNSATTAKEGLRQCEHAYGVMLAPFSLTLLGMGSDGHFASLFPNSKHIKDGMAIDNTNLCIDIDASGCPVAGEHTERISMTLAAILRSEQIILLITGKEKLDIVKNNLGKTPSITCPISFLINQTTTRLSVYWAK